MADFAPERFASGSEMMLAGIRRTHRFELAASTIPAQWSEFHTLGPIPNQVRTATYGAVCGSTPEQFEYLTGVEVTSFEGLPSHLGRMRVPTQLYAVFIHRGPVALIQVTWEAIWKVWLPSSGCQPADTPDFELYDERFDRLNGVGEVEIWFPIIARPSSGASG